MYIDTTRVFSRDIDGFTNHFVEYDFGIHIVHTNMGSLFIFSKGFMNHSFHIKPIIMMIMYIKSMATLGAQK